MTPLMTLSLIGRLLTAADDAAPAPAGGEDLEALLQQTVVTGATKSAEVSSVAPATVTVITAESLNQYGIHSLDEALNFLSLGMVTQNPLHSVDIGARGVLLTGDFGNHVLLLLNGQTLNEQWDGTAYFERGAAIPWELVDHIEVIVGPGSVLYGSNAMFGVINVVTKRARDYGKVLATVDMQGSAPVDADGNVTLRNLGNGGGSVRAALGGATTFSLLGQEAEVIAQLEYFTGSGPKFTFGPQTYGDDAVTQAPKNFGPKSIAPGVWGGLAEQSYATQVPAGHVRLVVGDFSAEVRAASYWRTTPYINQFNVFAGDFDDPNTGELDRFINLDVRYRRRVTSWLGLSAELYGGLYDYRQDLYTSAAEDCAEGQDGCYRVARGFSKWLGLQLQGTADWASDGRWVTLLGVDGRLRNVGGSFDSANSDGTQPIQLSAYDRVEQVLGVYLQQELKPWRWLSANIGGRLDVDSRFGAKLSPRAAIAATAPWSGTFKVSYAEAFRAPTAYELYYSDGANQISPAGLKPETVRSGELSYEQRVGLHRVMIGGFISRWEQMVLLDDATQEEIDAAVAAGQLRDGASDISRYRNVSTIINYGGNLAAEGSIANRLRYGLNVTLARSQRLQADGTSLPLTVAPQLFGNARLAYDFGSDLPTLAAVVFFAGPRPVDRAFDGGWAGVPYAPPQVDLKVTLSGAVPKASFLSYRLGVTYAFGARSAYVAGPLQAGSDDYPTPQLAPVDRLQIGLQLVARWP